MGRLKLKGKPVMNCNELYELADIAELLCQHREFNSFAISTLRFGEREKILSSILIEIEKAGGEYNDENPPKFPKDYQEEIAKFQQEFMRELPKNTMTFGFEYSVICIAYLARIPLQKVLKEDAHVLLSLWNGEITQEDQIKDIIFSQEETVLTAGRLEYRMAWQPDLVLKKGQKITTHRIRVVDAGARDCAVLHMQRKNGEEELLNLKRSTLLLVNVVDGVAVAVLDNVLQVGSHKIVRDAKGIVSYDGIKLPYSDTITSFAISESTGKYICVCGGKLVGTYVGMHNYDQTLSFARDLVEVRFVGDTWYLLTETGSVLCQNRQMNKFGIASLATVGKEKK